MSQSQKMRNALLTYVIPNLIANGFVGEYPHYKKLYNDRVELLVFQTNNWGNSFTVEVSTIFLPESSRNSNFNSSDFASIENATVWDTNLRYRLKGKYDGWFYYTDVYKQKIRNMTFYKAVSEKEAQNYSPGKNEVLVQKADEQIYRQVCDDVNRQMEKAFQWWDAFNKNKKFKMIVLEKLS
jgi:hypothetical protein